MAVLVCPKKCSPSFLDKTDFRTTHRVLEEKPGSWLAKCEECGHEEWQEIPRDPIIKHVNSFMRYPRYCASTGQTFQDKHAEKKYVRENKLEAL